MSLVRAAILIELIENERRLARIREIDQEMNQLAIVMIGEHVKRKMREPEVLYVQTTTECPNCNGRGSAWRVSRSWFYTHKYDICSVCNGMGKVPVR